MKMNVTRRDLLRFGGGAAAGVMLTPAPWKLVDDLAIWTQNWSWIPVPPRGPVTMKTTACALCPAGCAMKARCVGGLPVSMHGANGERLCTLGLTAHHLPYHPARLATPVRRNGRQLESVGLRSVVNAAGAAIRANRGAVAVLDLRPDRSVSWAWRRCLAGMPQGVFIPSPARSGASLAALEQIVDAQPGTVALDLAGARTVLSFGAPAANVEGKTLIVVGPNLAHFPEATTWLSARPGTEAIVAMAIANVLLSDRAVQPPANATDTAEYRALVAQVTPALAASIAGLSPAAIVESARTLVAGGPSVVTVGNGAPLGQAANAAILGLNVLLASTGRSTGVLARTPLPAPASGGDLAPIAELETVPDHSVAVLFIDASAGDAAIPWPLIERVLVPKPLVVALSPYGAGSARYADFVVPTLPFLETLQEAAGTSEASVAKFTVAPPLMAPRRAGIDPATFIRAIGGTPWTSSEELMKARTAAIHHNGRGSVTNFSDGSTSAVSALASETDLWDVLAAGGRWQDEAPRAAVVPARVTMLAGAGVALREMIAGRQEPLTAYLHNPEDQTASAAVSPATTKLYQESGLRRSPRVVIVNPRTARLLHLRSGRTARLHTAAGAIDVTLATDPAVMPGVVEVSSCPDALALGGPRETLHANVLDIWPAVPGTGWRSTAVRLVEA